ncbi:unnamed protein product [Vitrella brassicaformis CCMP3155]|uniref:Uncharacterized protein n=1 Tax=Vitrella brassicaformis (strain CCMP3155) TaxID=1169540 RepID=A0A0G4EEM2_VITBC|nr:unnamed protein product [Vitrella brassicaformis CCMP3155]|eukprot:CEL94451.1 unnamed protein product [Vitrella brassicaformis CCMP3155]
MAHSSSAASQAPHAAPLPLGCRRLDDVEIIRDFVPGRSVSRVDRQLLEGCVRRTFTEAEVTRLIRQGADPGAIGSLRVRGISGINPNWRYSCLCFVIDRPTNRPFLYANSGVDQGVPVLLPQWSSRELQRDIINALVDGGADVNAAGGGRERPIRVAIEAGNLTAVDTLLARQADVRGLRVMRLPYIPDYAPPATREYEDALMSVYRRLIQRDSTLAAERSFGDSLVHEAARSYAAFSQQFIDQYLNLITSHGADMTATDNFGSTPLHVAAAYRGSPCVADWLCRQLTADDVSRGLLNQPNRTPIAVAAEELDQEQQQLQQLEEGRSRRIRNYKTTIRVLLRGGAAPSIARVPTATEEDRRRRQLVLAEYATVLSELSEAVMSAINGALAPQRDHSMLLARLLPLAPHHDGAHPHPSPSNMAFGPHEAEAIGWKIGAFLHEPPAAVAAIDQYLIGESVLRRRVRAAVAHFVKSAATQTSSNREVVGGTRHQQQGDKRVKVTVPPLQCFAVRGSGGQVVLTGVREVVHRARLDEAVSHGIPPEGVVKGFNEHLGDQDCQFTWQQLGRIDKGTEVFVSLGID